MIYCKHCGKKLSENKLIPSEEEGVLLCPLCGEQVTAELKEDEVRPLVQIIHKKRNVFREKISTGLSMLVIGVTLLIIGILFYYLAFKLDQANTSATEYYLNTASAEFWVFLIGTVVGGVLIIAGSTLAIVHALLRKTAYSDAEFIRATSCAQIGQKENESGNEE